MKLTLIGHEDRYAVEQLQMSLFDLTAEGEAVSKLHRGKKFLTATTKITLAGRTATAQKRLLAEKETVRLRRQLLQQCYYNAAVQLLPETPPWGALAGVRPTKITTKHLLDGGTEKSAHALLRDVYYVTAPRRELAVHCSKSTVRAAALLEKQDVSLYVGIPFCPTRCSYCSFVSRTVGKHTDLIEPYLQALLREIEVTGQLMAHYGKTVRSIYIGGGTPTTLSAQQMETLLKAIRDHFDLRRNLEFTVEGGRPDTLTPEKLRAIAACGADRMSINPQSMVDAVLRACGRPHSAEDVKTAFRWAKDAGFKAINMDLIAGLPTDDFAGFQHSLNTVCALAPDNITVHTLALKKGADLFERRNSIPSREIAAKMVEYANKTLTEQHFLPYYLYRQKYMSGSFENVGWSKNGTDCLYNIYMMEELHTVVSLGGGGMNKVNLPDGTLQRFHNPKFPEQYIELLPQVLADKERLFEMMV